jgi:hypothetical protein
MAHEVETMMYVGEEPWHKLGKAIPEGKILNIQEAISGYGANQKDSNGGCCPRLKNLLFAKISFS